MLRLPLKMVGVVVSLAVVYLGVTFVQVWMSSRRDEARSAEAIVVFGAAQYNGRPSAVLRARLDHAVDLWRKKLAPYVVVTGGKQPGDRFTEATGRRCRRGRSCRSPWRASGASGWWRSS